MRILSYLQFLVVKFMTIGKHFETDNGMWSIEVVRSILPGHLSGWVTNKKSNQRYVFSIVNNKVRYMREYKPPKNLPNYLTKYLLHLNSVVKPSRGKNVNFGRGCRDDGP